MSFDDHVAMFYLSFDNLVTMFSLSFDNLVKTFDLSFHAFELNVVLSCAVRASPRPTTASLRPRSAVDRSRSAVDRLRSAVDFRIIQCLDEEDDPWAGGGRGGEVEEDDDTLDEGIVGEIFGHMDAVQRDKTESRSVTTFSVSISWQKERERALNHVC
jgi:hypothetical protein